MGLRHAQNRLCTVSESGESTFRDPASTAGVSEGAFLGPAPKIVHQRSESQSTVCLYSCDLRTLPYV